MVRFLQGVWELVVAAVAIAPLPALRPLHPAQQGQFETDNPAVGPGLQELQIPSLLHPNQQIGAKLPDFAEELRPLVAGGLNFLHTTDTHAWYLGHVNQPQYSADWGDFISFTDHMRAMLRHNGADLILVDTGDKHDGNGLGDVTEMNGNYSSRIFTMQQGYDVVTIGNHELYVAQITQHEYEHVVPAFGDRYVCTNVDYIDPSSGDQVPFGNRSKLIVTPARGWRILALGILFDFHQDNARAKVTPIAELIHQHWFKDLLTAHQGDIDMLLVVGHIPVSHDWDELQLLHRFLRSYFPTLPIQYLGGHSHIRDFAQLDSRSYGLQSGRYCETVGWLSIQDLDIPQSEPLQVDRKYIDFNLHSFMHHSNRTVDDFNTQKGLEVSQLLGSMAQELQLGEVYGLVPHNYLMNASPVSASNNLFNLLSEQVLPRLTPSVAGDFASSRLILINTGSIRYDLYKGPFTKNSKYIVSPFKNKWNYIPRVPKHVALRIQAILNNESYIAAERTAVKKGEQQFMLNLLAPEHKFPSVSSGRHNDKSPAPRQSYFEYKKRSYGYVTHDDFGSDGDDTIHRPFGLYPAPNAIQSYERGVSNDEGVVDVVFYDFIQPHVIFALDQLHCPHEEPRLYNDNSEHYNVGQMLQDYVEENWSK